ncbi:mating type 1-2 [Fusarium napiforme]|uniref:DNA mismatch repair protein MSH5 n=1 Tax=Fusarium napiforme TaxID=42672 RepID=A0A8H5J1S9_9HYPO|nr:mating type 1-2 [Fusarium napiforme]
MPQQILPTPPSSSDGFSQQPVAMELHPSHPQGSMSPEQSFAGYSYSTRYSTPVRDDDSSVYEPSTVYSQRSDVSFQGYAGGLGITSNPYGPLPDEIGYNVGFTRAHEEPIAEPTKQNHLPYTPEASPSAPCSSSDAITTRSGLNIAKKSLTTRSPAVKTGRVQKRSRAEKSKNVTNMLSKPLSEAARDFPDIHVADIEAFVSRPTEERLSETSRNKKAGQIKRPMNAFMLYRKAYQEVAKTQCSQNNHQHVSKVCGAAWVLEPAQIKETFDQWARIERVNHQRAHPGYKFTPSKPRKTKRDGDGNDDYSDNDSDWNAGRARKSRFRHATRLSETPIAYDAAANAIGEPAVPSYHDMYAYPALGRPHSLPYDDIAPSSFDMGIRQYSGLNINGEVISRTPSPGAIDYPVHGLDGFVNYYGPPGSSFDNATPHLFGPAQYDVYDGIPASVPFDQEGWMPHMESGQDLMPVMGGYEDTTAQDVYLKGSKDDWKVEIMDEPGHFEDCCYSAQEHSVISSTAVHHGQPQPLATHSLPIDISIEALVATLIIVLGLVLGTPKLRPIKWHEWAGKIEREGEAGFQTGSGEVEKDYRGNPFSVLETRPGFIDIRKQRREFTSWVKADEKRLEKVTPVQISPLAFGCLLIARWTPGSSASSSSRRGRGRGGRGWRGRTYNRGNSGGLSSRGGSTRPRARNPSSSIRYNSAPRNHAQYSDSQEPQTHNANTRARSSSEPIQHEVVMAIDLRDNCTIGCAYFSTTDGILHVSEDIATASLDIAEQFLIHIQPTSLLVSARAPASFRDQLEKITASEGIEEDGSEESIPGLSQPESQAFRQLRYGGCINMNSQVSVGCAGALLGDVLRRRSAGFLPDGQVAGVLFRVVDIRMFSLNTYMYVSTDALLSLQILQTELHPNSQAWGPDANKSNSKESLSVYGLFHHLACTPQGRTQLRQLFLRPLLDLGIISERQRTITVLLQPDNADKLAQLTSTLRKIRNMRTTLAQLRKGIEFPSAGQSFDRGVWATIQKFTAQALTLREIIGLFNGGSDIVIFKELMVSTKLIHTLEPASLVVVGDMINKTIDFEQSKARHRSSVRTGIDTQLDELKRRYMRELDEEYGDMYCQIGDREVEIIHDLAGKVLEHEEPLLLASDMCGEFDAILALALGAEKYDWHAPQMVEASIIHIEEGRHPLQELVVPAFIPNPCHLFTGTSTITEAQDGSPQALVLTGPNHSGKSVYLKQTAIIVYLAHIGSFVPAVQATIGLTESILTCISPRESMSGGESAFARDMKQAALSMKSSTPRSLVLVDEFGKGTNGDDGAGLLAALLDYYLSLGPECPRLLAATHFHEVFECGYLENHNGLRIAHMNVRMDWNASVVDDQVTFLFNLEYGHSTSSFGGRCAALNGVPSAVVERAENISKLLARNEDLSAACARLSQAEEVQLGKAEMTARLFLSETFGDQDEANMNGEEHTRRSIIEVLEDILSPNI